MASQTTETVPLTGAMKDSGGVRDPFAKLVARMLITGAITAPVAGVVAAVFEFSNHPAYHTSVVIGHGNMLLLARSAERGLLAGAGRAQRVVAGSYYARFAMTVIVLAAVIIVLKLELLPLLAGFTVAVATTIISVILSLREES